MSKPFWEFYEENKKIINRATRPRSQKSGCVRQLLNNNYQIVKRLEISEKRGLLSQRILNLFAQTEIDYTWSFSECTRKDTTYITHGYHRYPAKFKT